jgi:hypothetical protein
MMNIFVSAFVVVSTVLILGLLATGHWTVSLVAVGLASIAAAEVYTRSKRPVTTPAVK